MSAGHKPQLPRPRPGTKSRRELSASPVPAPAPEENTEPRRPSKTHSKEQPSPRTSASPQDAPRPGSPSRRDDLRSVGAWCDDIPAERYTTRITLDAEARAQHLPRAPTPPSPPHVRRLDSPNPAFLAYDTEFRVIEPGEDDRVGNAWYIARQAKTSRQRKSQPRSLHALALSTCQWPWFPGGRP